MVLILIAIIHRMTSTTILTKMLMLAIASITLTVSPAACQSLPGAWITGGIATFYGYVFDASMLAWSHSTIYTTTLFHNTVAHQTAWTPTRPRLAPRRAPVAMGCLTRIHGQDGMSWALPPPTASSAHCQATHVAPALRSNVSTHVPVHATQPQKASLWYVMMGLLQRVAIFM